MISHIYKVLDAIHRYLNENKVMRSLYRILIKWKRVLSAV